MKLVITANGLQKLELQPVIDLAKSYFDEVVMNPWGRRGTQDEIKTIWSGADAIICGAEPFDKPMIDAAPDTLKVLSHYGVGVDSIDIPAAKERGIMVCNTPGANSESVADMAMCLLMACARQVINHDKHTRLGEWKRFKSIELGGKRLGIVGFGAIGRGVAKRAAGFGMEIVAYDPFFNEKAAAELGVKKVEFTELLSTSDFVSLHLPVTPETTRIMNRETLSLMKPTAFLINTARGDLIDEDALYEAVKEEKIAGAGLDVYAKEPAKENKLFELENITFTPHCSANTAEAAMAMGTMAVENAYRAIKGLDNAHIL